jgi:glycosyltransferase involved in cell wall biosynthesis
MKILILNHNNENYGTYYRCFFLGKNLARKGNDVTMICASGKNFDLSIRKKRIGDNFKIITLPRIKYHKYFTGQLELRLPLLILFALFYPYDVLHAFTVAQPQIGIPAWIAKKIRRKKVIVDWDDLWGGGFGEEHPFPIKQVLHFFETKIPFVADRVTVSSEYLLNRAKEIGLNPGIIHKIPNGTNVNKINPLDKDESRERLKFQKDTNLIVSVGRTYTESLNLLFATFVLVAEKILNTRLVMVGVEDLPESLKKRYRHIMDQVSLTGPRPYEEVPLYMAAADVLVLPMADNNIEKARFPMRFGDYLCSGRPIVSNAVGEVKFYLENYRCGITSDPSDPQELAENILRVLGGNEEIGDEIGRNSRYVAREILNWEKVTEDLNRIYKEVFS